VLAWSGSSLAAMTRSASLDSWWPQRWPTAANGTEFLARLSVTSYGLPARSRQLTAVTDRTEPSTQRRYPIAER
jgi:hypothetical protein